MSFFSPSSQKAFDEPFYEKIREEALAMAHHAFSSGFQVPANTTELLPILGEEFGPAEETEDTSEPPRRRDVNSQNSSNLTDTLDADYNSQHGGNEEVDPKEFRQFVDLHTQLARIIAPATPRSILLMKKESKNRWRFLGPVPLVRQMMMMGVLSLSTFLSLSFFEKVDEEHINKSLLTNNGFDLFLIEMFLLSAAALGASFANLFEANRYCTNGTFDPRYNSSYWVRFVLGMIAGLLLSEIISLELLTAGGNAGEGDGALDEGFLDGQPMAKPILAMLGGFSSDLVFRILRRIVSGIDAMIRGNPQEAHKASQKAALDMAQMDSEREKLNIAANLTSLQDSVDGEAKEELQKILKKLTRT